MIPFVVLMFLLSRWSGGLVERYGARGPLVAGPLIAAAGYALLARPGVGGVYWTTYFPAVAMLGLGMALSVAPLTTVVLSAVPEGRTGAAAGVNNATSQVAALLALAVFAPIFFHAFAPSLSQRLEAAGVAQTVTASVQKQREKLGAIETEDRNARAAVEGAFVTGFRVVTLLAAGLGVLASVSAALTIPGRAKASST